MHVAAPSPPLLDLLMTETQERFLRSVLTRVPVDSVVELHLFPPIRRGTLETGVAVIATVLPPTPKLVVDAVSADEAPAAEDVVDEDVVAAEALAEEVVADEVVAENVVAEEEPLLDETEQTVEASVVAELMSDVDDVIAEAVADDVYGMSGATIADEVFDEVGDAAVDDGTVDDALVDEAPVDEAPVDVVATPPAVSPRMRILTASYRHTIKGVERGKWAFDVQEEADAPLDAVELVLRGVRHRSTEPADPELVSHDALLALIAPAVVAPAA